MAPRRRPAVAANHACRRTVIVGQFDMQAGLDSLVVRMLSTSRNCRICGPLPWSAYLPLATGTVSAELRYAERMAARAAR